MDFTDFGWRIAKPDEWVFELYSGDQAEYLHTFYWWKDRQGLFSAWANEEEEHADTRHWRSRLHLEGYACASNGCPQTGRAGKFDSVFQIAFDMPHIITQLESAGFEKKWKRSNAFVFEKKHPSRRMNLPSEFVSNIEDVFGETGRQFLANLPALIDEASQRWGLTDVQPSPELSYNFVAFAKRGDEQVVLKMGVPNGDMESEIAALRLFGGEGACNLIDYDEEKSWMLLERLKPGVMLSTLENDEEATNIAADVMQRIWRPVPENDVFIRLADWFDGLKELRAMFNGGTGPLNEKMVERVERSVKDFFAENHKPVLMHGDFHHYNILSSERGWLVIDPKGVIGPACYEVGPFLINPWGDLLTGNDYRGMTKRRIDILHEHLGFERERIHEWGLAHAILSAWWSIEDQGIGIMQLAFAEMIADLDIK